MTSGLSEKRREELAGEVRGGRPMGYSRCIKKRWTQEPQSCFGALLVLNSQVLTERRGPHSMFKMTTSKENSNTEGYHLLKGSLHYTTANPYTNSARYIIPFTDEQIDYDHRS